MVNIGLRVLFRPSQSELPSLYRQLGQDYDERVLPSICNEVSLKEVFSGLIQYLFSDTVSSAGVEGCGRSV